VTAPPREAVARAGRHPEAVHDALVCVAAPALAVSDRLGQWRGEGIGGLYYAGRRLLGRCVLRVAGEEPVTVQAGTPAADRARFVAVVRTAADRGPDPAVAVERVRTAEGVERVTLVNSGSRPLRLPVEIALGTDLAPLAEVAAGQAGRWLACTVSGAGLRWTDGRRAVRTTAHPAPDVALAAAGELSWRVGLPPGGSWTVALRTELLPRAGRADAGAERAARPPAVWPDAQLEADDPRAGVLLRAALDDLQGLLLRDPRHPADLYAAAGAPWRLSLVPCDALWAARMLLPFGTRLAAGTLRALARTQEPGSGLIPGPPRDAGPHLPPATCAAETASLFVTVLAEAWRWGLPVREAEPLLAAAERCLGWLRGAAAASGAGGLVADPVRGGPLRAEVQAFVHRAALQGADMLEGFGRPGAEEWRERAAAMRAEFRRRFWLDGPGGGRPAAALAPDGRVVDVRSSALAHLLDGGLTGGGETAPGLLDRERAARLCGLLAAPDMDSGWGLRTLSAAARGFSPFGHRSGAVRVHETAVAAVCLARAGHTDGAAALLAGVVEAAAGFGMRLPEIYAGEQRLAGGLPCPHPMACRPAALAAAGVVHLLAGLAGVRPDVPGGSVALRPPPGSPVGAVRLGGMRVARQPFAVRIGRSGTASVEEAAAGLRLGA
jgi:hypothetical protein